MPQLSEHEIEVFNTALELPSAERAAYLDQACAGDTALRRRVEALLQASEESCACLEGSAAVLPGRGGTVRPPLMPAEKPGDRIGRYKLLQQIGEGGCGVVYMAEQEEPVRRRVALKVIKLGMDTKSVIARFEAERQALALMDHPNIAKVLEAGATDTGRPYFVMELVRGIKITDYCDENSLSTEARLKMFVQVCQAIQHAHQKGIIHRDIKPSNILVADHDGVPVPKVIDFGIAKATTDQRLTDKTLFTAFEQFIGTPAYVSPEQARLSGLDIDTRSDIYSLGVLLYELLTGQTPFDAKKLLQAGLDEIRRTIREQEPPRPSTCLSTMLGANLTKIARLRKAEPPKLIHLLRGDLDWIVMKCLEKDRARRYETANSLAADIQRHLSNEPVVACPPSNLYRFQKLVRRNKLAFAGATLMAVVLVAATGISAWEAVRATRATAVALAEKQRANRESAEQEAGNNFLNEILASTLHSQSNSLDGEKLYEDMIALARKSLGESHLVLGELYHTYANFLFYKENKPALAAEMYLKALPIRRADTNDALTFTLRELGQSLLRAGKPAEAEPYLREAATLYRNLHQSEDILGTATTTSDLADALYQQHRLPEAEQAYREALAVDTKLGTVGSDAYVAEVRSLREVLRAENKPAEIETLYHDVIAAQRAALGKDSPVVVTTLFDLANLLKSESRTAEAAQVYREAVGVVFEPHGKDPLQVPPIVEQRAQSLVTMGRLPDAEQFYEEAIEIARQDFGKSHPALAVLCYDYGSLLRSENKLEAAAEQCRNALQIQSGAKDDALAATLRVLGWLQLHTGKPEDAEQSLREVLDIYRALPQQEDYRRTAYPDMNLGIALFEQHKLPGAEQFLHEAVALISPYRATNEEYYIYSACWLAMVLKAENKPTESESLLHDASSKEGDAAVAAQLLANASALPKEIWPDEAAKWLRYSSEMLDKAPAEDVANLSQVVSMLVEGGYERQATNLCRRMLNSTSTNALWFNNASWCLATTANPTNRDPALAVELAKRAVEINPQGDWNTVAVAYYRAGDFKQALADLPKFNVGNSYNSFFLAMAEHHLGHADAARQYYDQAIQWMNAYAPQNPELLRFRAEAEQLLGPEARAGNETQIPVPPTAK